MWIPTHHHNAMEEETTKKQMIIKNRDRLVIVSQSIINHQIIRRSGPAESCASLCSTKELSEAMAISGDGWLL